MRDIFRLLIAPFFLMVPQLNSAAAQKKVSCATVQASAIVEAEAGITVSYLGNPTAQTCTFYVRKAPPPGSPSTPQQKASKIALGLWSNPDEKQILYEFIPALQAALLEPIEAGQYEAQFVQAAESAFKAQSDVLAQCAIGGFFKKVEFQSYGDTVSCGVQGGRYFVVEAKTPDLVWALFLPLEE